MLTARDRQAKYDRIEGLRKTRIDNVRQLQELYGSVTGLARALGQDPSFICAIAGPNPRRNIAEALARDIEFTLKLPEGWLDQAH